MRLIVLGATGGTGLEIVRKAIERGHSVTAFVRSAERLKPLRDRIIIRQGNLLDADQLAGAVRGYDAVLSAFGPRQPVAKGEEDLLSRFSIALTNALVQAAMRRVILESSAFLFKNSIVPPTFLVGRLFFSRVVDDLMAMERIVRASDLDWTLVRPPRLTDAPYTGRYRLRVGRLPRFGLSIPRADVAECMIRIAEDQGAVRGIVGVSR